MNLNGFIIVSHGTLVGFQPLTAEARAWWEDNVAEGPALGDTRYVEHRYAWRIIDAINHLGDA